jgi:hypothetical protein
MAFESGKTTREVGVHYQWLQPLSRKCINSGKTPAAFRASQSVVIRCAMLEPYEAVIREQLAHSPSITLKELQNWLENEQSLSVSISAIDKFIRHKLGYRYKKRSSPVSSSARMLRQPVSNGKPGSNTLIFSG